MLSLISDSAKTIGLLALDFYKVIVHSGFTLIDYHFIEITSSKRSSVRGSRIRGGRIVCKQWFYCMHLEESIFCKYGVFVDFKKR